jgi:hypothetical protein
MHASVAAHTQPTYSGFEILRDHPQSQAGYAMKGPFASVGRNPTIHSGEMDSDANAAYQLALMGHITADLTFTAKSIAILDAWASTLQEITGLDAVLCAGLGPFKFLNAAEIVRYTTAVSSAQIAAWQAFFRKVLVPSIFAVRLRKRTHPQLHLPLRSMPGIRPRPAAHPTRYRPHRRLFRDSLASRAKPLRRL